jgi:hypothetical protein
MWLWDGWTFTQWEIIDWGEGAARCYGIWLLRNSERKRKIPLLVDTNDAVKSWVTVLSQLDNWLRWKNIAYGVKWRLVCLFGTKYCNMAISQYLEATKACDEPVALREMSEVGILSVFHVASELVMLLLPSRAPCITREKQEQRATCRLFCGFPQLVCSILILSRFNC